MADQEDNPFLPSLGEQESKPKPKRPTTIYISADAWDKFEECKRVAGDGKREHLIELVRQKIEREIERLHQLAKSIG